MKNDMPKAMVVWFTGLSGSGKSTLAKQVCSQLNDASFAAYVLDGDEFRKKLSSDLGFGYQDRRENVRRAACVSAMLADAGIICLVALISPIQKDREMARRIVGADRFIEIFVDCPLSVCEARDVKGLYKRARNGGVPEFTGVSSDYERPTAPAITVATDRQSVGDCSDLVYSVIQGIIDYAG